MHAYGNIIIYVPLFSAPPCRTQRLSAFVAKSYRSSHPFITGRDSDVRYYAHST